VGEVIQNGLPIQMKKFSTDLSVTELLAFYKQSWSDTSIVQENVPAYMEKHIGEWYILSKLENTVSVVIQTKRGKEGKTEGYISVTDTSRAGKPNRWSEDFPRLPGTQIFSNTESVDKGRIAYTLILSNDNSVDENRDYYRDNMYVDDWEFARESNRSSTVMLYFKKSGWQCDITVTKAEDGKTITIVNMVELNEDS
jgi:hypothetical protein